MKVVYTILFSLLVLLVIGTWNVMAYDEYAPGCEGCHGEFTADNYVSFADGQAWGTSLHDGHQTIVSNDCDVCHTSGGRTPVLLGSSNGGDGLLAISCLGCHGRDEGATGINAAGLRQHHWNNGVTTCQGCHPGDSNPANFTPVEEVVLPPYYENPGTGHPNIPDHSCNLASFSYSEDVLGAAGTGGLDNDGDNLYDTDDLSCEPLVPIEETTWGQIKALYN
jgi:hypothetical protein